MGAAHAIPVHKTSTPEPCALGLSSASMRFLAILALTGSVLLAVGCGDDDGTGPADAGVGVDATASDPDAGPSDEDAGPPDGGCDVSPEPDSLPAIAGGFAIADDGDGGSNIPVATGGDPTGTWVFDDATFYVTSAAAEMFDESASTVTGTAWVALDGTEARLDFDLVTTLEGTLAGTIVRPSSTQVRGTYEVEGSSIVITRSCAQSTAAGGGGATGLEFSIDGDQGTLITTLSGATGMITIVLEGTRRTP